MRDLFDSFLNLLKQRRVWAFMTPLTTAILRYAYDVTVPESVVQAAFTDLYAAILSPQVSAAVSGVLALWSYAAPKSTPTSKSKSK